MSRRRWIVTAVVAVVVLGVCGPFVYIHFIQDKAPGRFVLNATGGGGGVPLEGTWSVAEGSQAGFRVGEVLLGQHSTAVGRTSAVSGTFTVKGTTVESGSFSADMRTVHSEQPSRDRAFHRRIMDTTTYPAATFTLTKPIDLGTPPASGLTKKVIARGNLTLRGTTRAVTIPLKTAYSGTTIKVLGNLNVVFSQWNIPNPSFAGLVTTEDHGELEFLLDFAHGSVEQPSTTTTPTTEEPAPPGPPPRGGGPPPAGGPHITVTPTTLAPLKLQR